MNAALLDCIVENTCLLLESKAREIVNSALGLLKVLLAAFPDTSLAQYLEKIVSCVYSINVDIYIAVRSLLLCPVITNLS